MRPLILFAPPFNSQSLFRAGPASFDAFYPAFDAPVGAELKSGLLYLEFFWVVVNAVLEWALMQGVPQQPHTPRVRWQNVLQWLVIANLLVILLFPPFETQPDRAFEGFRFALGGSVQRGIFLPFLFLELFLLALDAAALWLAFGLVTRWDVADGAESFVPGSIAEAGAAPDPDRSQIGRSDHHRRQGRDPNFGGPEPRKGIDRRK